jgi:hypothetical protein
MTSPAKGLLCDTRVAARTIALIDFLESFSLQVIQASSCDKIAAVHPGFIIGI